MDKLGKKSFMSLISILIGVIALVTVIPVISGVMNKPKEESKEYYDIIINIDHSFEIDLGGPAFYEINTLKILYLNDILINLGYLTIIPNENYYFRLDVIDCITLIYGDYNGVFFFYDNDYGIYDFSEIELIEEDQILTPIFTPF